MTLTLNSFGSRNFDDMKDLTLQLDFLSYQELSAFAHQLRCGVSHRYGDGYRWEVKRSAITQEQFELFESYVRDRCVWEDPTTGLMWFYDVKLAHGNYYFYSLSDWIEYGPVFGYSDWRHPRLDELKSLRRTTTNPNKLFVSPEVQGRFARAYYSVTTKYGEKVCWDFLNDCEWTDDSIDSKFHWSTPSSGNFEGGRPPSLEPETIFVRGWNSDLPKWLQDVRLWIEKNERFDYPGEVDVLQGDIGQSTFFEEDNFPPNIESFTALSDISFTQCTRIPCEVYELPQLQSFYFRRKASSSNEDAFLLRLSEKISHLSELERLFIVDTHVESIPEGIGALRKLKEIYINSSIIEKLPTSVGGLRALTKLSMAGCGLTVIPDTFRFLTRLQRIDFRENLLISLPDVFTSLQELTELSLNYNSLKSLPPSIWSLNKLNFLNLESNFLTELPTAQEKLLSMPCLRTLLLGKNQLIVFPPSILAFRKLEWLSLSDNKIDELPDDISDLQSLKRLSLKGCPITKLPESFIKLENLEELDLRETRIAELPSFIWTLKSLKTLDLRSVALLADVKRPDDCEVKVLRN